MFRYSSRFEFLCNQAKSNRIVSVDLLKYLSNLEISRSDRLELFSILKSFLNMNSDHGECRTCTCLITAMAYTNCIYFDHAFLHLCKLLRSVELNRVSPNTALKQLSNAITDFLSGVATECSGRSMHSHSCDAIISGLQIDFDYWIQFVLPEVETARDILRFKKQVERRFSSESSSEQNELEFLGDNILSFAQAYCEKVQKLPRVDPSP